MLRVFLSKTLFILSNDFKYTASVSNTSLNSEGTLCVPRQTKDLCVHRGKSDLLTLSFPYKLPKLKVIYKKRSPFLLIKERVSEMLWFSTEVSSEQDR